MYIYPSVYIYIYVYRYITLYKTAVPADTSTGLRLLSARISARLREPRGPTQTKRANHVQPNCGHHGASSAEAPGSGQNQVIPTVAN